MVQLLVQVKVLVVLQVCFPLEGLLAFPAYCFLIAQRLHQAQALVQLQAFHQLEDLPVAQVFHQVDLHLVVPALLIRVSLALCLVIAPQAVPVLIQVLNLLAAGVLPRVLLLQAGQVIHQVWCLLVGPVHLLQAVQVEVLVHP